MTALAGSDPASALRWLDSFRSERAREEVSAAGLESTCRHRETYPSALRELPDAPATLYVAGGLERLAALTRAPAVAVVGARDATAYGLEVATALGQGLSAAGVTVVSGLALGVDAAAHRGATDAGGRAVAVL
ncbi:MAG TPA: DNA-processing protein DprA, partial [Thermoleophilaceae bacterium]|nr:DNA-processing protein DprA [Thermoleophilaceae bacterium]